MAKKNERTKKMASSQSKSKTQRKNSPAGEKGLTEDQLKNISGGAASITYTRSASAGSTQVASELLNSELKATGH